MLEVRRLRALHAVGQRGTIAAAADALDLTPSAVSQQLAALEREVGRALLEPDGRSVRLTAAGRLVLAHADTLFEQLERLEADLATHDAVGGLVRIGAFATALRGLVAPVIVELRTATPDVTIEASELEGPEAFDGLARRRLDLVISMEHEGAPRHDDARLHRRDLLVDVLDVALPEDHPLAEEDDVALGDLRDDPFVLPPKGWLCDEVAHNGCLTAGFSPRPAHRTGDWASTVALVAAGSGVALIPRLARIDPPPGVVLRALRGEGPCRHLFAACRRGAEDGPALRTVLEALERAAAAAPAPASR